MIAIALAVTPAGATEEDAKTFFAQGRKLRAEGNCSDAIVSFRRALDVFPQGLGALRNIAECEEQLGQFASSRNDWWSLRRAVLQSNEPKYEGWDKDAEQGYERLASKVAKITVRLHGGDANTVRVSIDGKPLDPRLVGVELERDLGIHTFEAFYGGVAPVSERRTLSPGMREVVTLEIPTVKDSGSKTTDNGSKTTDNGSKTTDGSKAPDNGNNPPPDSSGNRTMRAAGGLAIGVGVLGAIGTGVAIAVRQSAIGTVKMYCKDNTANCQLTSNDYADANSANNRAKTASTLVNVFGGLAIAGLGVGVALVVVGSGSSSPSQSTPAKATVFRPIEVKIGASPTPGGAQVWTGWRF